MKSYKLIKEYPGCVYQLNQVMNTDFIWINTIRTNLKDYPEYWEEVVEKDYEILSLITNNKTILNTPFYCVNDLLKNQGCNIHSVKRLSDKEVFTVGDKVRIKKLQCDGSFIIDKFYFDCNKDKLLCDGKCVGNGHVSITKIEKVKQPLFTTEDGVEIFEGDKIFSVNRTNFQHYDNNRVITNNFQQSSVYKYFSTKEAAEEYILMNKPCLSVNDLNSIITKRFVYDKQWLKNLEQLVKSKL